MRVGAMNHPAKPLLRELEWVAEMGLEFVDLTLEPPAAAPWSVNAAELRRRLQQLDLGVVGHTPYYLPIASPFERIRSAAVDELRACIRIFAEVGAAWMNVHPDRNAPMHGRSVLIERNLLSLTEILEEGRRLGVGVMVENLPGEFNSVEQLEELLEPLPTLGLHLDLGHCNLQSRKNTAGALIRRYGSRLKHVHLHDNKGGSADLHLPLGTGTVDAPLMVQLLQDSGYDDTITLEVFSSDDNYLRYSSTTLRSLWSLERSKRSGAAVQR